MKIVQESTCCWCDEPVDDNQWVVHRKAGSSRFRYLDEERTAHLDCYMEMVVSNMVDESYMEE